MNGSGGNSGFGWMLVIVGLVIAGFGLIWVLAPNLPRLGRLPGDIVIERENSRFYFPIVTCIVVSVVLSLVTWLIRALRRVISQACSISRSPGSCSHSPHLAPEKLGEVLGIVAPNSKDALLPVDHDAIPAPEIPEPAVAWSPMDAPAIQERGATNLDVLDVVVPNSGFHERKRSKANRQSIALILDREVMEGQPDQDHQQCGHEHHRKDDRLFTGYPGENEAWDGRAEQDHPEGSLLRVGVGR